MSCSLFNHVVIVGWHLIYRNLNSNRRRVRSVILIIINYIIYSLAIYVCLYDIITFYRILNLCIWWDFIYPIVQKCIHYDNFNFNKHYCELFLYWHIYYSKFESCYYFCIITRVEAWCCYYILFNSILADLTKNDFYDFHDTFFYINRQ